MRITVTFFFLLFAGFSFAQEYKIYGVVSDASSNETIIGATIVYETGKGTVTDIDGKYSISLPPGKYQLEFSFVGYDKQIKQVEITNADVQIDIVMSSPQLKEVEIVSDIAISRKTPVAFSNINPLKIQEQLGSQDLPMILNSTPGVYATQQGGGDGDARVSIRGFNQQNVAVMVDGIPMNDMQNNRVYWTNWFGLDNIQKGMQVQRGLGASKLAIPAIGGTVNILTSGIDAERKIVLKQEVGNNNNFRTVLSGTTGRLKGNWGVTAAGSFRSNQGWVDKLNSEMYFYYFKAEKVIGKHLISATAFGAPQKSAQRYFGNMMNIAEYNKEYAYELGYDTTGVKYSGWRYNNAWGSVKRTRADENGPDAKSEVVNSSVNQFHKPVISLKEFWTVTPKLSVSNILYASYGRGGGTTMYLSPSLDSVGQMDFQPIYDANAYGKFNGIVDPETGDSVRKSTNYIKKNYNIHDWYGYLATANYEVNKHFDVSGGVDLRTYKGRVFSKVNDFLGGDVITSNFNQLEESNVLKRKGDTIGQNVLSKVRWMGAFALAEYKGGNWSSFLNVSGSLQSYKRINYFSKKDLFLSDTTIIQAVGYGDTITRNGVQYTMNSAEAKLNQSPWLQKPGFTVKGGFNYNLTEKSNVYINVGYLSKAPLIGFAIQSNNRPYKRSYNELIKSCELGYTYASKKFSMNSNLYYTLWNNRPTSTSVLYQGDPIPANVLGLNARHMGAEFDFVLKPIKMFALEGAASIGDWEWTSIATAVLIDESGSEIGQQKFDPRGVKVGDAPQSSYMAAVRFEPIKSLYIRPSFNYFGRNWADMDPSTLKIIDNELTFGADNVRRQSWRIPDYYYVDVNTGYGFKVSKFKFDVRLSVINVTNNFFITDAKNNQNGGYGGFDVQSANVNVGMGRRWTTSLTITF